MRTFTLIVLSILLFPANDALACSCAHPAARQIINSSAAIFAGVAQRSRPVSSREAMTTFRVTRGYKGVATGRTIWVRHLRGPSPSCGIQFTRGTSYVVMTNRGQPVSLCSIAVMRSPAGQEALRILRR